ncbi:cobalt ECF transporter T component CbiQ [Candidatus Methanomassiliicoccus intestinalis]|uniref:cobalt ECF transporter T component CbiQ n=1 Tax=Candidatus Methanomassiliicoccus intestinalis TaxID=1406512 RepID=UPI0037DCD22F
MHNHNIDEIAYSSRMLNWSPLGKFILMIFLLIGSLLADSLVVPIVVFCIGAALLFYSTNFKIPKIIGLALAASLVTILFSCIIILFVTAGDTMLYEGTILGLGYTITDGGLRLATLILVRSIAGMTVMLSFATSTPVPYLAHAMRQIHLPKEITELVVLIYRYSFLLLEELQTMWTAASCRLGFHGLKNKVRTTSKIAVGLFIKSLDITDRAQIALQCRNFNGEFPSYRLPKNISAAWIIVPIISFILLYFLNIYTRGWIVIGA